MEKLKSIEILRFPLAVLVVIEHVFCTSIVAVNGRVYDPMSFSGYRLSLPYIEALFDGVSVPIFFFISGYLFFRTGSLTYGNYLDKLKRRVRTLLIPYIIWNAIVLLIEILKFKIPNVGNLLSYSNWELNLSFSSILSCFWEYGNNIYTLYSENGDSILSSETTPYPINGPLWFIRDLMIVVLLSPIIYHTLVRLKHRILLFMGLLWLLLSSTYSPAEHITLFFKALFFFSFGAYFSIYKKEAYLFNMKYISSASVVYFLFAGLAVYFTCSNHLMVANTCRDLRIIGALIMYFGIANWVLKQYSIKLSSFLSIASFFLYASHAMIYMRTTKLFFLLLNPQNDIHIFMVYVGSTLLTILISLFVCGFINKYMPKFSMLLTGRKS